MYRTERVSEDGLKHLVTLYKAAFGKNVSLEFLRKKFNTHVFGASYLGYLAFDEETNQPAAYYGVFPVSVIQNGKTILTAQSGDTMTHPAHQGKGLFTKLATLTYELAKAEGVQLVWGFPNKNSYPGFTKKLNWLDNGNLTKFKIKVGSLPFAKLVHKINKNFLSKSYTGICKTTLSNNRSTKFFKENTGDKAFVSRNTDYFDYKNYFTDRFVIETGTYKIWAKVESSLLLGDMFFKDENDFISSIDQLKSKCRLLGITEIVFICNSDYPYFTWFQKLKNTEVEDSLPFCHLAGWNDELAKNMVISFADLDTF